MVPRFLEGPEFKGRFSLARATALAHVVPDALHSELFERVRHWLIHEVFRDGLTQS